MFPVHPIDSTTPITTPTTTSTITTTTTNTAATLPNTPPSLNSPSRHGRKLSHVQFGKRPYNLQDEYASSAFMLQYDEKPKHFITTDSTIEINKSVSSSHGDDDPEELQVPELGVEQRNNKNNNSIRKRFTRWFFRLDNIGPFTIGDHWALFTYLMFGFTIIIFSGELLLSKQSSGEFFELEPFNYMLGPSMEIMIQSGARFPPCMRKVDSMPSDQKYVCLHTISQSNLTPFASNRSNDLPDDSSNQLMLLDPAIELTDPRLLNSTCSLSTICGMTAFHQHRIPDQTYRLLSPLFIHTGLIHLCINMAFLVVLGSRVERTINSLRFTLLYIGSGIFGHALGANFSPPTTPFLGCSSSIFGLIGFLYVDILINWKKLERPITNLFKLLVCTGLTFSIGILPGVDTFSHMGGLISGVLLSVFLLPVSWWTFTHSRRKVALFYLLRVLSICLFGVFLGLLIHKFSISKLDQVCPYCRYISCLPINGFCD
ncbi:rhomboid family-domain-containing protein [Helicostylum pulchrum]|nr:rhomboid family-domain-containing protein [Helicostylum pulchrum]